MTQPIFSFVLISRNEEETLPRLLASIKEFRDRGGEVIICDTGSTDNTAQIAREHGCVVEEVGDRFRIHINANMAKEINERFVVEGESPLVAAGDSLFDYASARNYAASLAKNDMVAMPDCDEIYTKMDLEAVEKAIREGATQLEYNFVFSHDEFGNEAIKFMHSKFYNRKNMRWTGVVHEILFGEAQRRFLPENVVKLEHFQNEKTNRSGYLKGLALDCFLHPDNDRNSHYLGRELVWTGRPKSAIRELTRHVGMHKWPAERSQSMVFIGDALNNMGQPEAAAAAWHEAYRIEPGRREPLIRLADAAYRANDAQKAAAYAEAALTISQSFFYADNAAHYTHVPHDILYWAYWRLGRMDKSKEHFFLAFSYRPLFQTYLHDLRFYRDLPKVSVILPTLGREEGLAKCLKSLDELTYPQDKIERIILDGEEGTVPEKVDKGLRLSTGEYVVYAANDMTFHPDSIVLALLESEKTGKGLVAFNSGPVSEDEGNACEHFLIRKSLVSSLKYGQIFCTKMRHCGVDNFLWAQCKKMDQAIWCKDAKIDHRHFSRGSTMDDVYSKGWSHVDEDRAILKQELELL